MAAGTLATLVVKMAADVAQFQNDMGRAVHIAERNAARIQRAFSAIGAVAGGAFAGFSVAEIITRTVDAERSLNRMGAALKATGYAAGLTRDELNEMADQLKASTAFDDDDIRKGITSLLRFRDVQGEVFRDAARLATDLAGALDIGLVEAFTKIGRALADPERGLRGLREAGVKLSEQQLDNIKAMQRFGNVAGAQRAVLQELEKSIGGTAVAENVGLYGAIKSTSKAWDDFLKAIGKAATTGGLPTLIDNALTKPLLQVVELIENPSLRKFLDVISSSSLGAPSFAIAGTERLMEGLGLRPQGGPEIRSEVRGVIRGGPGDEKERARRGKEDRDREREAEIAAQREELRRKKSLELQKSSGEELLKFEQQLARNRQQILDAFNDEGLVSVRQYYEARRNIAESALRAELAAVQQQLEALSGQRSELEAKGEFEKIIPILVEMNKLLEQRKRLVADAFASGVTLASEERKAMKALADEVENVNIQLLEMQNKNVEATQRRFALQTREQRQRFETNAQPEGVTAIDEMGRMVVQRARQALADEVENVRIQLLELQGNIEEATRRRLALQTREQRRTFTANARPEAIAELDEIERMIVAQAQFNKAREDESRIQARLQIEEERIQNSRRVGAISELEALQRTGEARRKVIAALEAQVVAQEAAARASGNEELVLQAEQARAALERLRAESDLLAQAFDRVFTEAAADAFSDFIDGTKSASEAFKSFVDSVTRQINRMVAEDLAVKLKKIIFGEGKSGGSGSALGSIFAGFFGSGTSSSAGTASMAAAFPNDLNPIGALVGKFASGTDYVPRTGLALVHKGEAIIPASGNKAPLQLVINQSFAPGTDRRTVAQAAAASAAAASDAMRRNR